MDNLGITSLSRIYLASSQGEDAKVTISMKIQGDMD